MSSLIYFSQHQTLLEEEQWEEDSRLKMTDLSQVAVYSDSSDIYKVSDNHEVNDGVWETFT